MGGVMGVDPSLQSTGLAHWSPLAGWDTDTIATKGSNADTHEVTAARLDRIVRDVERARYRWSPDLVVVEVPAFSRATGHAADRAGLFHLLCKEWRDEDVPVAFADSQGRICYAVGKFAGQKDAVMAVAVRRYLDAEIRNNNEADAVLLVAMGARHRGQPVPSDAPSQLCLRGMGRVQWPSPRT